MLTHSKANIEKLKEYYEFLKKLMMIYKMSLNTDVEQDTIKVNYRKR
jgi:hypothetical protein